MSVSFIVIALLTAFFYDHTARIISNTLWKLLFILTASFLAFVAVKASVRKFYESALFSRNHRADCRIYTRTLGGIDLHLYDGFFLWDYATVSSDLCYVCFNLRYTRIKSCNRFCKNIDAHEEERKDSQENCMTG